jgi:MurNAc alpha-1-phosphate uridylyltransferase
MSLPVAILAGGLATRLRPVTERIPKALIDIAGQPFAAHQLDWLRSEGIDRVVFLVGYRGEMIREELGDGSKWGLDLDYVFDGDRLLGTGGALRRARPQLGSTFWVLYGDSYLRGDLAAMERAFAASGRAALMTVFRNEDRWDRSNVRFENGEILNYDKTHRTAMMKHIDYGLGIITSRALEPYPANEPFDLATVYQDLLQAGDLAGYEVPERFYEIGSPEGLAETRAFLESRG